MTETAAQRVRLSALPGQTAELLTGETRIQQPDDDVLVLSPPCVKRLCVEWGWQLSVALGGGTFWVQLRPLNSLRGRALLRCPGIADS